MDRCRISKELSAYLDDQLPAKKRLEVERHLSRCGACNEELARLKGLSEKLRSWQVSDLDPGFDDSVKNKIVSWELERGQVKVENNIMANLVSFISVKNKTIRSLTPVFAVVVVFLVVGSQLYFKRGIEGSIREAPDNIMGQFPQASVEDARSVSRGMPKTTEYEPYYLSGRSSESDAGEVLVGSAVSRDVENFKSDKISQGMLALHEKSQSQPSANGLGHPIMYGLSPDPGPKTMAYPPSNNPYPAQNYSPGTVIVVQPQLLATNESQKIIRTADVHLRVLSGQEAYQKANAICQELGGYLASLAFNTDGEDNQSGKITMRIPQDKFLTALDKLSALGKVEHSSSESQDVSQQYANLKSRFDAEMVVYNKMLEALQKRQNTIPEAMRLESELTPVLQRIQTIKNEIDRLDNLVSYTTINVFFSEPPVSQKALKASFDSVGSSILEAKINLVKFFAGNLFTICCSVVFIVVFVAVGMLVAVMVRRWIKKRQ